jgi:hypothetical protein
MRTPHIAVQRAENVRRTRYDACRAPTSASILAPEALRAATGILGIVMVRRLRLVSGSARIYSRLAYFLLRVATSKITAPASTRARTMY